MARQTVNIGKKRAEWELNCLREEFKDLFILGELEEFACSNENGFPIITNGRPIFQVSALPADEEDELMEKVDELLISGHLEYSDSPWSSPVRLNYINGKAEICVDYKNLNEVTEDYRNRLPTIPNVLGSISQSDVFSKVVLKDAYHQLKLGQNSRKKTAFVIGGNQYQFKTYHHGLKNADHALQETMDELLENLDQDKIKVYRGQILVHTNGYYDHLETLRNLFRALRDLNLKVDIEESQFLQKMLVYLGKTISKSGIMISPDQLNKIKSFKTPENISNVRSFLGLVSQYKHHVNRVYFDQLTQPLYDLIHSNVPFYWEDDEHYAFFKVKTLMVSARPIPLQKRH